MDQQKQQIRLECLSGKLIRGSEKATKATKATKLKDKTTNLRHGPTKATNSSGELICGGLSIKLYSFNGLIGFAGTDSSFVGFSLSFVGFVVFVGFIRKGPGADLESLSRELSLEIQREYR